jgi:hypothetical protein
MRLTRALLALVLLLSTTACGSDSGKSDGAAKRKPSASASKYPSNVVHLDGMGAIRFGDNRTDLESAKLVVASGETGCDGKPVYDVPGYVDAADLVFNAQGKLGFVWVLTPGVYTPEKLTVDSPVAAVRKAYPQAEELPVNQQSFPGLLVKSERTAYLFLYEPSTNQIVKLLAGYTDILRQAQNEGITC